MAGGASRAATSPAPVVTPLLIALRVAGAFRIVGTRPNSLALPATQSVVVQPESGSSLCYRVG